MGKTKEADEKLRALRKELAERTVNLHISEEKERRQAADSSYSYEVGREISRLISDEHLEEARARLEEELDKYPDELMFLNLQMVLDIVDKPSGSYDKAKEMGSKLMEIAVKKDNPYYAMTAIGNMGYVAHNEGHDEFSKMMYLAAHFIDRREIFPMRNLACWYSRRGDLEEALSWIDKILDAYPDWQTRPDIATFLKKDEGLNRLRSYQPFIDKVLSEVDKEPKT